MKIHYTEEKMFLDKLILEHPEKVIATKEDPAKVGWWVGQIMKEMKGLTNPQTVHDIVRAKFDI